MSQDVVVAREDSGTSDWYRRATLELAATSDRAALASLAAALGARLVTSRHGDRLSWLTPVGQPDSGSAAS